MAEGTSPTTPNWVWGPSLHRCSALAAESLQTAPHRFWRGETQIPQGNVQSCRNPTHSPRKCSWRNHQHLQYAEFWDSLLYFLFIWGSWKPSSLQPQARQKTAISSSTREADFLGKPHTSQSLERKTREEPGFASWREGRRAAHSVGTASLVRHRLKHPRVLKSSEAKLQPCSAPPWLEGKGD